MVFVAVSLWNDAVTLSYQAIKTTIIMQINLDCYFFSFEK